MSDDQPTENQEIEAFRYDPMRAYYNRRSLIPSSSLSMMADLLQPQTQGFSHVNNDMSFGNLDQNALSDVRNCDIIINFASMYGFKKLGYLERGKLSTLVISNRAKNGKSMDMFTSVTTINKQEFSDKTEKKTGFGKLFGKKTQGQT